MSAYVFPIASALLAFPFVAAILVIPYLIFQYRKYGGLPIYKSIIFYSFVLYCIVAYFLIMLPMPTIEFVAQLTTPTMELRPFHALWLYYTQSGLQINDISTYLPSLVSEEALQIIFNVFLLLPLGVYCKYFFKRKWWQVLIIGFCTSLFFELTQLSGLYGIYPRPYRLFEVDDLICNTLGAVIGCMITPLLTFFLPNRDKIDSMSYKKGKRITISRRFVAFILDNAILGIFTTLISYALFCSGLFNLDIEKRIANIVIYAILVVIYFMVFPSVFGGKTIGKAIVHIKVVTKNGSKAKFHQLVIRYALLYFFILPCGTVACYMGLRQLYKNTNLLSDIPDLTIMISCGFVAVTFILNLLICSITRNSQTIYGKISGTVNVAYSPNKQTKEDTIAQSTLPKEITVNSKDKNQPDKKIKT